MLLKQLRDSAQGFIHLLGGSKLSGDVRFEYNHVRAFRILYSVLASHACAEVVSRTHCVLLFRHFPSRLLLHNSCVQLVSLAAH